MDNQTVQGVAIDILIVRMRKIVNLLYLVASTWCIKYAMLGITSTETTASMMSCYYGQILFITGYCKIQFCQQPPTHKKMPRNGLIVSP